MIGNVSPGSIFANLQRIAMTGVIPLRWYIMFVAVAIYVFTPLQSTNMTFVISALWYTVSTLWYIVSILCYIVSTLWRVVRGVIGALIDWFMF